MGNKSSRISQAATSLPDTGPSTVTLRPDFPEAQQAQFLAALQAYHLNQGPTAAAAVRQALQSPGVAGPSWRLLDQLVRWHDGHLWSQATAGRTHWADLHTEEVVVLVAEAARERLTIGAVVGLDTASDAALFDRQRAKVAYLSSGLAELLERVPMPPSSGAVVTDVKVFGRILYHHIMNTQASTWGTSDEALEKGEQAAFRALCDYLLRERRVDLLILAVEYRDVTDPPELKRVCETLKAASLVSASKYQAAKCELWRVRLSKKASKSQT